MTIQKLSIAEEFKLALSSCEYNKTVFMLPPWKKIYTTDKERMQNWEEAVLTFEEMVRVYLEYGYEIIEVPRMDIEDRCKFVLNHVG